jgi:hypothetical protein
MMTGKGCGRKWQQPILGHYINICIEEMKTKYKVPGTILIQNRHFEHHAVMLSVLNKWHMRPDLCQEGCPLSFHYASEILIVVSVI